MEKKIEKLLESFKERQFDAYYAEDESEAVRVVNSLILEQGEALSKSEKEIKIGWGGSVTLNELGIKKLCMEKYDAVDPYTTADPVEAKRQALLSDVFLMSANAITEAGELVNIDGNGNRLGALIHGPLRVIIVAGVNKIVKDKNEAIKRIKQITCPQNARRLERKTPCALEPSSCGDCKIAGNTMCSHTVVTRFNSIPNRIKIVLVNKNLGF